MHRVAKCSGWLAEYLSAASPHAPSQRCAFFCVDRQITRIGNHTCFSAFRVLSFVFLKFEKVHIGICKPADFRTCEGLAVPRRRQTSRPGKLASTRTRMCEDTHMQHLISQTTSAKPRLCQMPAEASYASHCVRRLGAGLTRSLGNSYTHICSRTYAYVVAHMLKREPIHTREVGPSY